MKIGYKSHTFEITSLNISGYSYILFDPKLDGRILYYTKQLHNMIQFCI